jgi:PAT family beta-lactamase induction signal transducer AmpG
VRAMPSLSQNRLLRLIAFGALYFAQGVPAGFVTIGYVLYLTDQGLSNTAIGATMGLMVIPWTFKIAWAPLLDRVASTRFGRRRPFIIAAELAMGLTLLPLMLLDPKRDLSLIGAALFLHSTFVALQDTAVDAMAVDLLPPKEKATANGVMWAAKTIGIGVGGVGGTIVAKHIGWPTFIVAITAILWTIMLFMILVRERPPTEVAKAREHAKLTLAEVRRSFGFSTPLVGMAIAMLTPVGYFLVSAVYSRSLRADLKMSEEAIGMLQGVIEPIAGVAGALAGGVLADRLGVRKVIGGQMACVGMTLAVFAFAPGLRPSFSFLAVISFAAQFFMSGYFAALVGFLMRLSNPAVGALQIAIFTAAVNLTNAWAAPVGGRIADAYGVSALFGLAAALQIAFIALLPFCDPRVAEARFRPASAEEKRMGAAVEASDRD